MKIGIGNDHAAVELKNIISEHLKERGCEVVNFGTDTSESFDYPIAGYKVGKAVANGDVDLGILICGTGVGISLAANKVEGVRAVVCSEPFSASSPHAQQHQRARLWRPRRGLRARPRDLSTSGSTPSLRAAATSVASISSTRSTTRAASRSSTRPKPLSPTS